MEQKIISKTCHLVFSPQTSYLTLSLLSKMKLEHKKFMKSSLMFAVYMPQVSNIGERRQLIQKNKCEENDKRKKNATEILVVGSLQPTGYSKTFIKCAVKLRRWQKKTLPYFRSNNHFCWKVVLFFFYRPRITQQNIIIL